MVHGEEVGNLLQVAQKETASMYGLFYHAEAGRPHKVSIGRKRAALAANLSSRCDAKAATAASKIKRPLLIVVGFLPNEGYNDGLLSKKMSSLEDSSVRTRSSQSEQAQAKRGIRMKRLRIKKHEK